jgi:hypothetical protein
MTSARQELEWTLPPGAEFDRSLAADRTHAIATGVGRIASFDRSIHRVDTIERGEPSSF